MSRKSTNFNRGRKSTDTRLNHRIGTDGLPPGMYWLRISGPAGENYGVRKVVVY